MERAADETKLPHAGAQSFGFQVPGLALEYTVGRRSRMTALRTKPDLNTIAYKPPTYET